jgi:16S rRNA G527 N7-methylase RsmG
MINLEQVKLLESKVAKAIDYVERLAKENAALNRQETEWQTKLESYQKRIDELEVLVMGFKEDQGRIEEGILAALDRLSQFEKAIEKSLNDTKTAAKNAKESANAESAKQQTAETADIGSGDGQTCFEIPESAAVPDGSPSTDSAPSAEGGELDIF